MNGYYKIKMSEKKDTNEIKNILSSNVLGVLEYIIEDGHGAVMLSRYSIESLFRTGSLPPNIRLAKNRKKMNRYERTQKSNDKRN